MAEEKTKCKSYEIYKTAVEGVTMNGDKMKELDELPEKIQNAWCAIDKYYLSQILKLLAIIEGYRNTREEENTMKRENAMSEDEFLA